MPVEDSCITRECFVYPPFQAVEASEGMFVAEIDNRMTVEGFVSED